VVASLPVANKKGDKIVSDGVPELEFEQKQLTQHSCSYFFCFE